MPTITPPTRPAKPGSAGPSPTPRAVAVRLAASLRPDPAEDAAAARYLHSFTDGEPDAADLIGVVRHNADALAHAAELLRLSHPRTAQLLDGDAAQARAAAFALSAKVLS